MYGTRSSTADVPRISLVWLKAVPVHRVRSLQCVDAATLLSALLLPRGCRYADGRIQHVRCLRSAHAGAASHHAGDPTAFIYRDVSRRVGADMIVTTPVPMSLEQACALGRWYVAYCPGYEEAVLRHKARTGSIAGDPVRGYC